MHDAAFRAFGGRPQECVYDQTRLVVIAETVPRADAQRSASTAMPATAGFRIRACEGYDPESKGKVEAGVKYVKQDGLYGRASAHKSPTKHDIGAVVIVPGGLAAFLGEAQL